MPDIGDIFKDLVWNAIVNAALKALFSALPFLGWGPVGWVVSYLVHWAADKIFDGVKEYIDLQAIAFKKMELAEAYSKHVVSLKRIALVSGVDSEEFRNAQNAAITELQSFIKFNG